MPQHFRSPLHRLRGLLRGLSAGMGAGGYPPEASGSQGRVVEIPRSSATAGQSLSREELIRLREESPTDPRLRADLAWISDDTTDELDDPLRGSRGEGQPPGRRRRRDPGSSPG